MLWTILAGAFIGWIASMIMGTNERMGALANIVAGLIGAVIGGFVARFLGMNPGGANFTIGGLLFGILGACILIGIVKALTGPKTLTR